MGDAKLSAVQKRQLQEDGDKEQKIKVANRFRSLIADADLMPMRVKTQYPAYLEVRMLHIMRGVAEVEGISVQELMRQSIQEGLDRRMRATKKKVSTAKPSA